MFQEVDDASKFKQPLWLREPNELSTKYTVDCDKLYDIALRLDTYGVSLVLVTICH